MAFRQALIECLARHEGFAGIPSDCVAAEYSLSMSLSFDRDRTMGLGFFDSQSLTGDSVRTLQRELLQQFPSWTIELGPVATRVRVDRVTTSRDEPIDDVDAAMALIRSDEKTRWETGEGVTHRQLEWTKPRLPALMRQFQAGRSFVVVNLVDNSPRHPEWNTIWVLAPTSLEHGVNASVPGSPATKSGLVSLVTAEGELLPRSYSIVNGKKVNLETPYELTSWVIPKSYPGDFFEVVDERNGTTTRLPLNRAEIIRDETLPRGEPYHPYRV